jgi:putative ribosome biogenesis GTPase RsgA
MHTHEERCAVKRAVERRQISAARYTGYLGMFTCSLEVAKDWE